MNGTMIALINDSFYSFTAAAVTVEGQRNDSLYSFTAEALTAAEASIHGSLINVYLYSLLLQQLLYQWHAYGTRLTVAAGMGRLTAVAGMYVMLTSSVG